MIITGKENPKYVPFIGWDEDYIGRSAWDFYSWGHIALGIASFLLLSLLITVPEYLRQKALIPWWLIIVIVIILLLIWEFVENVILWRLGWKFEDRQDSLANFIWDMVFGITSALTMWLMKWIIMDRYNAKGRWFYIAGAVLFGIVLVAYVIGYGIYKSKNKNK